LRASKEKRIMRSTCVSVLGVVVAAGCSPPPEEPEASQAPIIAGMADPGDPAMVEVFKIGTNSVSKCTATLVSPRVLLTAAHCIYGSRTARYGVFIGPDDDDVTGKDLLPVTAAVFDPMYNDDPGNGHDIGVVVLATPLSIKPVPINRTPLPASVIGKPARYVGYGLTNGVAMTGDGVRRHATAPIAAVSRLLIRIAPNPHGTCHGDSGGPLLMDNGAGEAVIGVVSFGNDAACRRDSYFQRLDTQVEWVDAQIKKYDPGVTIPDGGAAPGDAGVADAGARDTRPDLGRPDLAPDLSPDTAPPKPDASPVRADARVTPKPADARKPVGEDAAEMEDPVHAQALSGSACAVASPRARGGAAAWAAGALLACAFLVRRRRRTRR
jgi:V8-like Glu-specific endopeptidase